MAENSMKVNISLLSIIVLLISQLIVFSFGYGVLRQQVNTQNDSIRDNRAIQERMLAEISTLDDRLIRLEILLNQHVEE